MKKTCVNSRVCVCVYIPWCIFPADTKRETCPDGLGELVRSSPRRLVTGRRSLPLPASSPLSSSLFCHFSPLMVEMKKERFSFISLKYRDIAFQATSLTLFST